MKINKLTIIFLSVIIVLLVIILNYPKMADLIQNRKSEVFPKNDTREELVIGTHAWPAHEISFLAWELGYFKNYNIRIIENQSASSTIRGLQLGEIKAATLTLDEALLARELGAKLYIALIIGYSLGNDAIVAKTQYKNMKELKGKRVGVDNAALGAFVLKRALQLNDLSNQDITIISLDSADHILAYSSGAVDAVVTFEPSLSKVLELGGNVVFDSSLIPGEIIDVLVIRQDAVEPLRNEILGFLQGWFKAVEYLLRSPAQAAVHVEKHLKIPAELIPGFLNKIKIIGLNQNLRLLNGSPPPLYSDLDKIYHLMLNGNLLRREIDISNMIIPESLNFLNSLKEK